MENEDQVIVPPPAEVSTAPAILSPLGQQRYAMMHEVNQTVASLVTARICTPFECAAAVRISQLLARKIADELESQE